MVYEKSRIDWCCIGFDVDVGGFLVVVMFVNECCGC